MNIVFDIKKPLSYLIQLNDKSFKFDYAHVAEFFLLFDYAVESVRPVPNGKIDGIRWNGTPTIDG